jgi:multisubunit Na+/H+ antiporter MnhB subunit
VPKSKSKRRRYQPPARKKPKPSPRWFGALILSFMGLGVAVIVLNYLNLMPFTGTAIFSHLTTKNWPLFTGLGLIAAGFLLATQYR